jgi:hypothetical protein
MFPGEQNQNHWYLLQNHHNKHNSPVLLHVQCINIRVAFALEPANTESLPYDTRDAYTVVAPELLLFEISCP